MANRTQAVHPDSPLTPEPYSASPELITAVNLAIFLRRPLLLEGEAGCGKTRLAIAVAYELGLPFYRWNIRSTTKSQEGLYDYDALLRLHDVNLFKSLEGRQDSSQRQIDPQNADNYLELKALGKAFDLEDQPAVVLIDEIDKADLDFPNDLLTVLEEPWEFTIRETGELKSAKHPPIVIITSNKEKGNLPAPFLRRCIYHFIEFPNEAGKLQEIAELHYSPKPSEEQPPKALIEAASEKFVELRRQEGLFKRPGTSEFLDWLGALTSFGAEPYSAEALRAGGAILPYRDLLFKLRADWRKFGTTSPV